MLVGPAFSAPPGFTTYCGWKFGGCRHELLTDMPRLQYKGYCGRCMPAERQGAKDALAAELRSAE